MRDSGHHVHSVGSKTSRRAVSRTDDSSKGSFPRLGGSVKTAQPTCAKDFRPDFPPPKGLSGVWTQREEGVVKVECGRVASEEPGRAMALPGSCVRPGQRPRRTRMCESIDLRDQGGSLPKIILHLSKFWRIGEVDGRPAPGGSCKRSPLDPASGTDGYLPGDYGWSASLPKVRSTLASSW